MFLEIKELLNATEVRQLRALADELPFIDGRLTNQSNPTKHNVQVAREDRDPRYAESVQIVTGALG